MKTPKHKFYIDDVEVTPNYKSLIKDYKKESGQMFSRVTLSGNINIHGSSLINSSIYKKHSFVIKKYKDGSWVEYYKAYFTKTDCTVNYSRGYITLKLTTDDDYNKILDMQENTYNLLDFAIKNERVSIDKRPVLQIYVPGESTIGCFMSNTWWEQEITSQDNETELKNKYHFGLCGTFKYVELTSNNASLYAADTYIGSLNERREFIGDVWHTIYEGLFVPINLSGFYLRVYYDNFSSSNSSEDAMSNTIYELKSNLDDKVYYRFQREKLEHYTPDTDSFTMTAYDSSVTGSFDGMLYTKNVYARHICNVSTVDGEKLNDIPSDDFVVDNLNYLYCKPYQEDNIFIISTITTEEETKWGIADNDKYYQKPDKENIYFPIARSSWSVISFWFDANKYKFDEEKYIDTYTMNNSYEFSSCINALLQKINPAITHKADTSYSEFLYSEKNPITNDAFKLLITQKTNILKGEYDKPAQRAEVTFKDIMDMLKKCFQCYWFVEDGKLRIEHITWFLNGGGYTTSKSESINLNSLYQLNNQMKLCYDQSEVTYKIDELTTRYEFEWMDESTESFSGKTITVKDEYLTKENKEDINISKFSSDVDYMLLNPSNFSEDGFALLLVTNNVGSYKLPYIDLQLKDENGLVYTAKSQNGYATFAYLERFYMYNMAGTNIEIEGLSSVNGVTLTCKSVKKFMEQKIEFPYEDDPDENSIITTDLGYGEIEAMSIDIDTRQITATLRYRAI